MIDREIVIIPSKCTEAAGIKFKKVDIGGNFDELRKIKCHKGGKCIIETSIKKGLIAQEFEKPEDCPLRRLGRRSDNHDK